MNFLQIIQATTWFLASNFSAGLQQVSHIITYPLFRCPAFFCKSPFYLVCIFITRIIDIKQKLLVIFGFSDVTGMASSSVSQEDFDNDFELTSRRSRIRTARARVGPPRTGDTASITFQSQLLLLYSTFLYCFIIFLLKL